MKEKSMLKKWKNKGIEDWGSVVSKEYLEFQSDYRKTLKSICEEINFSLYDFNKSHYEFSAVVQSNTTSKFYYISISDVRYWENEWADRILYRTMEHEKDWSGGSNRFSTLENLKENLEKLDKIN